MLALGVFPDVSLAEARKDRDDAKRKLRDRIDTMAERQATKLHEKRSAADPFKAVAEEWMEKQRGCWTAGRAGFHISDALQLCGTRAKGPAGILREAPEGKATFSRNGYKGGARQSRLALTKLLHSLEVDQLP